MKAKIIACLVVVIVFSLSIAAYVLYKDSSQTIFLDWEYYSSLESAINLADVIIIGDVVNASSETRVEIEQIANLVTGSKSQEKIPYTISEVKVDRVIKGRLEVGEVIEVRQPGGIYNNVSYIAEDCEFFNTGDRYLMFIHISQSTSSIHNFSKFYTFLNPSQGSIKIKDGILEVNDSSLINEKVSEMELVNLLTSKLDLTTPN